MSRDETARRIRIGAFDVVLAPGMPKEIFPGQRVTRDTVRSVLMRNLGDDFAVRQLRAALSEQDFGAQRLDDRGIIERVAMHVEFGRWQILRRPDPRPPLDAQAVTDLSDLIRPEIEDPPVVRTHYVEIELVGEDDVPIPGARYRVELPNGTVRQGRTNDAGAARIEDIPRAGSCKISFPDLDADAWQPA
jgi:hypothetical protein